MKLTTRAKYGTRALLDLALHYGKGPVLLSDTAGREGLSEKYLQHLFHALKIQGIVRSERGVNGGFLLAKDPSQIKLSDVVTILEGPLDLSDCVTDEKKCSNSNICATQEVWRRLNAAIMDTLNSMTLEDLVKIQHDKKNNKITTYQI